MTPHLLAEVTRRDVRSGAEVVESRHHGHLVVVGPDGTLAASLGDADRPTFVRSAAKPFQATASLELAGGTALDLTDAEIAVGWASHRAEPRHLEAVTALLARSGTDPEELTTPPAERQDDPAGARRRIHHNCSGKHALFALAGRGVGCPRQQLLDPEGPVQQHVLAVLEDALGPARAVAVDGCGAPAVCVPLSRLAHGFRRLWLEERWERVRTAGLARPWHVGGEGELASALLGAGVLAKVGAEGVYGASWRDGRGVWGLAVKSEDGAARGAAESLRGLLVAVGAAPEDVWSSEPVLGGGRPQGQVRWAAPVRELAAGLAG